MTTYPVPYGIIIGAQKSASTFIQLVLADNDELVLGRNEEPFYERECLVGMGERYFLKKYNVDDKKLIIKRPNYFGSEIAAKNITKFAKESKLVLVLRNPIDRLRSAYFHYIRDGFIPNEEINYGLDKILSGAWIKKYPRSREIIDFSKYGKCFARYNEHYLNGNLLIVSHEDIKRRPELVIKKVSDFLSVNYSNTRSYEIRPQSVVYSHSRLNIYKVRNIFLYKYAKDKLTLEKRIAPLYLLGKIIESYDTIIASKFFSNNPPELDENIKSRLNEIFSKDLMNLRTILMEGGKAEGAWSFIDDYMSNVCVTS